MERILLIGLFLIFNESVFANSCCGQSPASFSVLSLEQSLSLTTSYSYIESQGRVLNAQEFYVWRNKKREIQSLQINLASSLNSRSQIFFSSSILRGHYVDSLENETSVNTGDSQLGYTYEVLPEYQFSYWKPIVYLSAISNLPTGKSIYDHSQLSEAADVTGYNQWGLGLGLTIRKVYFPLTLTFQAKSLKVFSKQFDAVRVSDFYDNSLALLCNYASSIKSVNLNLAITTNQLTQRNISESQNPTGLSQASIVLIGLQRNLNEAWGVGINYSDQTLIGRARNTILNKTLNLSLNYNYF
jgi:hypothetical protein